MSALPKLYAIADRATLDARGMGVRAFAEELVEGGVRLVQYRDTVSGPQEILRAASEIAEVFAGSQARPVMNDRADLAALLGWGCHVGQGDLPVAEVRALLGDWRRAGRIQGSLHSGAKGAPPVEMLDLGCGGRWVGVSTHTDAQVREAEKSIANYVALGPVFRTGTKLNGAAVVGLEGVRRARALTRKPLVAIGGITLQNARSVVEAGADSVAVISGLFVEGRAVREVVRDFYALLR